MVGNRDPVLRTSRDGNRMSRRMYSSSRPTWLRGGPQSCPVSQACPRARFGRVGAQVFDRALGCGMFSGRGVLRSVRPF